MMKSLYSGVAGMKTHNQRMDVIGNNISNVNTTAYKASAVTFKDVYYQTKAQASAGTNVSGGVNPKQVGYGVTTGTINQVMTQSGFTYSDSYTDCALEGEGFFQVMDQAGNIYYTRNGNFVFDNVGNLVDPAGNIVLGVTGDPTGVGPSTQRISAIIPDVQDNVASESKIIGSGYEVTVSANGYGPNGNIAITITDGDPFATFSASTLNITMDLTQDFATQAEFEAAVNEAINAGGVNVGDNVLPISIAFDSVPADTSPQIGSNVMQFKIKSLEEDGEDTVLSMQFSANVPGSYSNAYNIAFKTSSSQTDVIAKWTDNTLTITVPGQETYDEDETPPEITLQMIQNAIYKAAGVPSTAEVGEPYEPDMDYIEQGLGNPRKILNVTCVDAEGADIDDAIGDFNFYSAIAKNTKKISLKDGQDSFYSQAAKELATIKLKDGRFQEAQTHDDLTSIYIDEGGIIYGDHAVHGTLVLGRIDVVTFANPIGLNQVGTSYWRESLASGVPEIKLAGEQGAGKVRAGALEMSNVDLSQEFSDMIITQRGFQANSRIITVSDTMLEELINLKR